MYSLGPDAWRFAAQARALNPLGRHGDEVPTRSFGRFWWDFIVGDDWRVAAGLVGAFALTWLLAHNDVPAWWVLPLAVAFLLRRVCVARGARL